MIYGEKKANLMARDGVVCSGKSRKPRTRDQQKHVLYRYMNGDEDADVFRDVFDHARDWDTRVICNHATARWAIESTKDTEEPRARFGKLRSLVGHGGSRHVIYRRLRHYEEFSTERSWRTRHPLRQWTAEDSHKHEEERHARYIRLLREIILTPDAHRLFNQNIRHQTTQWVVWMKDAPFRVPSGVNGGWKTIRKDASVNIEKGPTTARKLMGLGDIEDFLRDIYVASSRPYMVPSEPWTQTETRNARYHYFSENTPRHTYTLSDTCTTRRNPEHHPEWLQSVIEFLDHWEEAKGDISKLPLRKCG